MANEVKVIRVIVKDSATYLVLRKEEKTKDILGTRYLESLVTVEDTDLVEDQVVALPNNIYKAINWR